ncbi:Cell wall-associated hydrolase, NlpC family [Flavobacterium segetis]|uniref:Cell wall-associated hydrolase, NlpC family n=2 Tax=Flavobacterium segetis TaxID=271157 RepID=A0A1M5JAV2_9FLAO|nr:Cell wall-associated hydrolase, NlpC family [Flavobacterium segetis]
MNQVLKFLIVILILSSSSVYSQQKKSKNKISSREIMSINSHQVKAKETLYGIAKQYKITVNELKGLNPELASSDLKIGQKIIISSNSNFQEVVNVLDTAVKNKQNDLKESDDVNGDFIVWEVQPKESKYSITRKYGISIKEFDKANSNLGMKPLQIGQKVNIPARLVNFSTNSSVDEFKVKVETENTPNQIAISEPKTVEQSLYEKEAYQTVIIEILPKETKYGIAKKYGLTVTELEKQNPKIKNKLIVGQQISITSKHIEKNTNEIANVESDSNDEIKTSKIDFNNGTSSKFSSEFVDQLIDLASDNIGTRYRTGGTSKSGFDCSGLMLTTFGAFDIKLPRTSREQSAVGTIVSTEEAQKGDLIFFKTNGRRQINHVGMVVEVNADEIKFIHSSTSNGVIISSTKERYYGKNFSQINRVVQ